MARRAPPRSEASAADRRPYRRGVGVALFNREGLVFVARRVDTEPAAWQMPQGGIDADEDPREAARRELAEETGIEHAEILGATRGWLVYDLPPALAAKVWRGRFRGQRQKWFAMRFSGRDRDIDLAASGKPEFSAWRWVPLAETPRLIVPFKRAIYERVAAEFAPLARPSR
jgi:putative (di)nucleoside polyphosphate hydrolase